MEKVIEIFPFPCGPVSTNAYLLLDKTSHEALVIDPSFGSFDKISPHLDSYTLSSVILTHSHWDHIADLSRFVEKYNPQVLVHTEDALNVQEPGSDGLTFWIPIQGAKPTKLLQDGDSITFAGDSWRVIHTPGHSPGGICLHSSMHNVLISGDTLFKGTIGRLDLPTGEPDRMWHSLKKLSFLPPETIVYSGHGPTTTIGRESWLKNPQNYIGG